MNKKFVDENIIVHYNEEAQKLLRKQNDNKFLSKNGIVNVNEKRWEEAQRYEYKSWMVNGLTAHSDHNIENMKQFDFCETIAHKRFQNAIELGCGPFTNIYEMERKIDIDQLSVLDPLLNEYLKHPNNRLKDYTHYSTPIENFTIENHYDLIVMINVLEHCFDIPKIFEVIHSIQEIRGVFVFGDVYFEKETIEEMSLNAYNSGHPIRMAKEYIYKELEKFKMIYRKEFEITVAERPAYEIYYIGEFI